jgi:hypothetical protein
MPNPQEKAKRYRDRSEECLRLSQAAATSALRDHYKRIAAAYISLAEAEETLARGSTVWPNGAAG